MRITLDRVALKALVDADPAFELELKSAVLSELARRVFDKDFHKMLKTVEPDLYKQVLATWKADADMVGLISTALRSEMLFRPNSYYASMELTGEIKEKIDQYATAIRERAVQKASADFEKAYSESIQRAVDANLEHSDVESQIERRVERLIEAEVNRRVDERFKARMAEMTSLLSTS